MCTDLVGNFKMPICRTVHPDFRRSQSSSRVLINVNSTLYASWTVFSLIFWSNPSIKNMFLQSHKTSWSVTVNPHAPLLRDIQEPTYPSTVYPVIKRNHHTPLLCDEEKPTYLTAIPRWLWGTTMPYYYMYVILRNRAREIVGFAGSGPIFES